MFVALCNELWKIVIFHNCQSYFLVQSMLLAWQWWMEVFQWSVLFVLWLVVWRNLERSIWILPWNKRRFPLKPLAFTRNQSITTNSNYICICIIASCWLVSFILAKKCVWLKYVIFTSLHIFYEFLESDRTNWIVYVVSWSNQNCCNVDMYIQHAFKKCFVANKYFTHFS